jgi:hypothetical protein
MSAGRPLRGPGEGGGFAAAHFPGGCRAGGRAARAYGAAPPGSRLLRIAGGARRTLGGGPGHQARPLASHLASSIGV